MTASMDPSQKDIKQSRDAYDVGFLIEQTRLVAADYYRTTGKALPVTAELARFDAVKLLNLRKLDDESGVDALSADASEKYLIKGRVIFKSGKARQKLGQISFDSDWTHLLMVIYDRDYDPDTIYKVDRDIIERELEKKPKDRRGSMTVAKYKAIGQLIWTKDEQGDV